MASDLVYLAASGGRTAALEQYGTLKGMALPLLNFPFGLLGSLAVLLMPEITQAHVLGQTARLNALLDRMIAAGLSTPERQKGIYFARSLAEIEEILGRA